MASEEASRRASAASSSDLSFPDSTTANKLLPKKEKANGATKLKKSITKKAKEADAASSATALSSPLVNGTSAKTSDDRSVCKHCKKPVDAVHYDSHVAVCLEKKQEQARRKKEKKEAKAAEAAAKAKEQNGSEKDADGDTATQDGEKVSTKKDNAAGSQGGTAIKKPPRKSATKSAPGDKKTKKRKADGDGAEKEPKKKKAKKEEKEPMGPKVPKPPKQKGPVNVEIQCGVPLGPEKEGQYCARSLTCKSHSMGLKRSVPGRSAPYDVLLAAYQKKNHARQQKALLEQQAGARVVDDEDADGAAVDSDEEKELVMKGLARWNPRPLEQVITVGVGRRYKYVRLKEALGSALAGTVGGGQRLFGVPALGGGEGGNDGADTTTGAVAGSDGPPQRAGSVAAERKGSVAGAASGGGSGGSAGIPRGVAVPVRKASVASSAGAA